MGGGVGGVGGGGGGGGGGGWGGGGGGWGSHFKNTYELLNLKALKNSTLYENRIFQGMGSL